MSLNKIFNEELKRVKILPEERQYLKEIAEQIVKSINLKLRKLKLNATVFVGGSLAKGTIIKNKVYDIDVFLRFDQKYSEKDIEYYCKRIFRWFKIKGIRIKIKKIHGSRDYYKIILKNYKDLSIEIIPVIKLSSPEEARNVTDLSFFHVNYVKEKIEKNPRLINQILLAKSFCHGQKCYGAESYIRGFSGYALELLIIYYKGFKKMLSELSKLEKKLIIDVGKHYKNAQEVLENVNKSKLGSPLVIIDPTFKQRNATSSLSHETFRKFKKSAENFLKSPSKDFFAEKRVDILKMKLKAHDIEGIFAAFEIKTKKQAGDIAGTKLLKFSNFMTKELSKYFEINEHEFEYNGLKKARVYYVLKRKKEIVVTGPSIHYKEAAENFKKRHKIWYIEDGKIKCSIPTDIPLKKVIKHFKIINGQTIKNMGIQKIKIV